jgi:hypothetical protein
MTPDQDPLDRLVPALPWRADWNDVLQRAGAGRSRRFVPLRVLRTRRFILAFVILAAVVIPLAALAAANEWWFLKSGGTPQPLHPPAVVREGEWDGHSWQLIAYPSGTDGLCFSITPKGSAELGEGGALSCAPFVGVSRTARTKASPDMTITFLAGSAGKQLPAYIAGPVINKATEVRIRFANGQVLRVPTFDADAPLDGIRFYATQVPDSWIRVGVHMGPVLTSVAGLDEHGDVVACLAPATAKDGVSPISDCG